MEEDVKAACYILLKQINAKLNYTTTSSEVPPSNTPSNNTIIAKGDSGATSHFIQETDQECLHNLKEQPGAPVTLPDKDIILPTHTGTLQLSTHLLDKAQQTTVLPGLKSSSLVSLGQLCDDDCRVMLTKDYLFAIKNNQVILQGTRNPHNGLWDIPLPKPQGQLGTITDHSKQPTPVLRYNQQSSHINVILWYDQDKHNLIAFLHAACFAPVKSTFLKAIQNNHFTMWPGLTVQSVKKHL